MRLIPAPGHDLEYWSVHMPKPNDLQSTAEFMVICIHELFCLLEDICAIASQVTLRIKGAGCAHVPDRLSDNDKDINVSKNLRDIYQKADWALASLAPIEQRLRAYLESWGSNRSGVPLVTVERFRKLGKEEKISYLQTHWAEVFKSRTQDTHDMSAFLRRVNEVRCLFCLGWVEKLEEVDKHFSKLLEVLHEVRGLLRVADSTSMEAFLLPETTS
jgi:hypothetical protein